MQRLLIVPRFPFSPLPLLSSLFEAGFQVSCSDFPEAQLVTGNPEVKNWNGKDFSGYDGVLLCPDILVPNAAPLPPLEKKIHWFLPLAKTMLPDERRGDVTFIQPGKEESIFCGKLGDVPYPSTERIAEAILSHFAEPFLRGKKLLITAGPTIEDADPARFVSNRSTGRMGTAIARMAARHGADVSLIHGPMQAAIPTTTRIQPTAVRSAEEMRDAVLAALPGVDIAILCAAVADFRPETYSDFKIKKGQQDTFLLSMKKTPDILATLGALPRRPFLVGFAAESNELSRYASQKLKSKHCDLICANNILTPGCGFASRTNALSVFGANGFFQEIPLASKEEVAEQLLQLIARKIS